MARAMENPSFADTAESLIITMLLGLYEVFLSRDVINTNAITDAS
jgi:hypothetical protein